MSAPELKPCPFCGGEAQLIIPPGLPYVCCTARYCTGPKSTPERAISAWNTRATPDPLQAPEVVALLDAVRPFSAAVFNDNGDVTISSGHITRKHWLNLKAALSRIERGK